MAAHAATRTRRKPGKHAGALPPITRNDVLMYIFIQLEHPGAHARMLVSRGRKFSTPVAVEMGKPVPVREVKIKRVIPPPSAIDKYGYLEEPQLATA
jgi:transcription antitermination factor NusG